MTTFRGKVVAAWAIAGLTAAGLAFDTPNPSRRTADDALLPVYSAPRPPVPAGNTSVRAVRTERNWREATCSIPRDWLRRSLRGYYPRRSPDLSFVPVEPHFFGHFKNTTTHSGPWDYLQKVPLVLYGPGFIRSQGPVSIDREASVADLAPTYARLLRTPFPDRRAGNPLINALLPKEKRNGKPRLIVTVVWDGGGWNTLDHWPNSWPTLKRLMTEGTSFVDAIAGSNPSVTPAIHANIGTGAYPSEHGIVSIPQRRDGRIQDSWAFNSPHNLEMSTLADIYDRAVNNRAKIGLLAEQAWHLGMMGHGAALRGGDRDIAVLTRTSPFSTNTKYYRLPSYMQEVWGFRKDTIAVDKSDGNRNGEWLGHDLPDGPHEGFANPAWTLYQMRLLRTLLNRERFGKDKTPDLFFTNFKQIDEVSHAYFLQSPEMHYTIPYSDRALRGIVRWLNRHVGKKRWVLGMTADHGVGPRFDKIGAWPIDMTELQIDIALRFGVRVTDLFQSQRPQGFWLNDRTLRARNITRDEISNFLLRYTIGDNVRKGRRIPRAYRARVDEKLFAAAWPSARLRKVADCGEIAG